MDSFFVDLLFRERSYRCFLQKLGNRGEDIYILNVSDGCLIDLFGAKKVMYCARSRSLDQHVAFTEEHKEKEQLWEQVIAFDMIRNQTLNTTP